VCSSTILLYSILYLVALQQHLIRALRFSPPCTAQRRVASAHAFTLVISTQVGFVSEELYFSDPTVVNPTYQSTGRLFYLVYCQKDTEYQYWARQYRGGCAPCASGKTSAGGRATSCTDCPSASLGRSQFLGAGKGCGCPANTFGETCQTCEIYMLSQGDPSHRCFHLH